MCFPNSLGVGEKTDDTTPGVPNFQQGRPELLSHKVDREDMSLPLKGCPPRVVHPKCESGSFQELQLKKADTKDQGISMLTDLHKERV